jgi:diguanylate cyclase (GGDEF)-like protein/PAS domain S-box-containing protein
MVNRRLFADMEGDIIVRKQVENALRHSEAHFREVFDNTAHGTFIIEVTEDGNFRIGDSNKAEEILTTIRREDVMGKLLVDVFPPEVAQALHTNYSRCLEAGESIAYEEEVNLPGVGQRFYYTTIAPVRDESGRFYRIIGSTLEITARKQMEENLRQLSRAVEQSPASIVITDTAASIEYVNPKFTEVTGYTLEEAIGKNPRILKTSQTPKETHRQLWERLTSGEEWRGEFVNRKKNGELYYEFASISPITDSRGVTTHYLAVKEDITERKQAEEALARHDQEISTLYEASLEINTLSDISTLLYSIIRRACELLKIRSGALYLFRRDDETLEVVGIHRLPKKWVGIKIRQDEGLAGRVVQTKKPITVEDYQNWEGQLDAFRDSRARRVLGIPLIIRDQITGVIVLLDKQVGSFSDNDIRLMSLFADKAAIAIENARLFSAVQQELAEKIHTEEDLRSANQILQFQLEAIEQLQTELREQAIRDPLTGLYNRRYLDETLKRELARAVRENYPISFVMIDIDYFKKINDTFGHGTGDMVLQKLATQLLGQTRIVDIVCRYGGEEFLIILPNTAVAIAFQIAERWRKSFMGMTMPLEYSGAQTTISCGISEFPLNGKTVEELISTADKAMYHAKATGRNRVVVIWQDELDNQSLSEQ